MATINCNVDYVAVLANDSFIGGLVATITTTSNWKGPHIHQTIGNLETKQPLKTSLKFKHRRNQKKHQPYQQLYEKMTWHAENVRTVKLAECECSRKFSLAWQLLFCCIAFNDPSPPGNPNHGGRETSPLTLHDELTAPISNCHKHSTNSHFDLFTLTLHDFHSQMSSSWLLHFSVNQDKHGRINNSNHSWSRESNRCWTLCFNQDKHDQNNHDAFETEPPTGL